MKLLALVLLLSAFSSLTLTEVMEDLDQWKSLDKCGGFFIRKQNDIIVPEGIEGHQYKMICQRWENKYRFATLYDTVRRIPVYSAYTFSQGVKKERDLWKIEPQLENIEEYKNKTEMMYSPRDEQTVRKIMNQAVDTDYSALYTQGHVFPCSYAADQDQADSTFTLTNAAPQTPGINQEWATQVEIPMKNVINTNCRLDQNYLAYIVTGAVPGNKWISITRDREIVEGINVPDYYWSAFCCTSKTDSEKLLGKAYISNLEDFNVQQPTIHKLNTNLTELYNKGVPFKVFPGLPVEDIEPENNLELID